MAVISGKDGAVKIGATVADSVANWSISETETIEKSVASNTAGAPQRHQGNKDWTGQFKFFNAVAPDVMPGDEFTFLGSVDQSVGVSASAICNRLTVNVPTEDGGVVNCLASIEGNGVVARGAAVAVDSAVSAAGSAVGTKLELGTLVENPVFTELDEVRTMDFEIVSENPAYNSSTNAGQTKRSVGNIDANISISVYTDSIANLPTLDDIKTVRIYVTASDYWDFRWIRFEGITDILIDIENAAIVGATITGVFSGYEVDGSDGTNVAQGGIVPPSGTPFWGTVTPSA